MIASSVISVPILNRKIVFTFNYWVLLIFSLLEVLIYDRAAILQVPVTVMEYSFIIFATLSNRRIGISYFVSFSLLSLGVWSYVLQNQLPSNFWGIRIGNISLNVVFSGLLFLYSILSNRVETLFHSKFRGIVFFNYYIIYSILIGTIYVFLSINYLDNYLNDLMLYLTYFIYIYILGMLNNNEIKDLMVKCISVSIITMMVSLLTGQFFKYADDVSFILMNSFSFILPFAMFFIRNLYTKREYYLLFVCMLIMIASGRLFIGSKTIIILVITILWLAFTSRNILYFLLLIFGFGLLLFQPITLLIERYLDANHLLSYKFSQVFDIFNFIDFDTIASSNTSMGNIIAEGMTIIAYLKSNFMHLFFGKGFGGGIPDLFGYLTPAARDGAGYNPIDASRNNFVRMHFPLFEIAVKAGIMGVAFYLILLIRAAKSTKAYSFIFFIMIFSVFSNSKEMLLLSLIFGRISDLNFKFFPKFKFRSFAFNRIIDAKPTNYN